MKFLMPPSTSWKNGCWRSGWPSPVSRKTPITCERWVTRVRAEADGV
jgi:hypothetical protein